MRILITCPAPKSSRLGNRVSALRWQAILRELGHRVEIAEWNPSRRYDVLLALHARRSADAVLGSRREFPDRPIVLALTGTDLYRDIHLDASAKRALEIADRFVVLQDNGALELPVALRERVRVIHQSCPAVKAMARPRTRWFDVCVVGHLRSEKDPLRTARASRLLPAGSRIRVLHAGSALSETFAVQARREMAINPRYRWLGERPRGAVRALIARSRVLVLSSRMEGGANVLSEALVAGTPVIASRISSSEAILGADYPGFFTVGATRELAGMLARFERDTPFRTLLAGACRARRHLFTPARERAAWRALLAEL